ncbi:hypothetical protein LCE44_28195 [Vibrio harveyi]|uniref:hypothetical protein n=1 Tax=Vibrio harveyi group TaxID=717610 RepID=UPI0005EF3D2C|nr:hypothetical protein [Vibrio campbellii]MCV3263008.1 hypothetical protein [Vibrio harveyi]
MAISIETVLKQIVKLSESDKGNLVSIQDLMCELDTNITNRDLIFNLLNRLEKQGYIEDISETRGNWGRDKTGDQISFGKVIRKL